MSSTIKPLILFLLLAAGAGAARGEHSLDVGRPDAQHGAPNY